MPSVIEKPLYSEWAVEFSVSRWGKLRTITSELNVKFVWNISCIVWQTGYCLFMERVVALCETKPCPESTQQHVLWIIYNCISCVHTTALYNGAINNHRLITQKLNTIRCKKTKLVHKHRDEGCDGWPAETLFQYRKITVVFISAFSSVNSWSI